MPRILIVTGEASGDLHGANLAVALKAQRPDLELLGVGGSKMAAAGVQLIKGIERLDAIGMPGLAQFRQAFRTYRALTQVFRQERLAAVVFIDNPGLNLRLARAAKRAGHRVIYYIAPQIWAWHAGRIHLIKRVVDLVLVILPFEEALYRAAGVPCRFVGNPVMDAIAPVYDRTELRTGFGLDAEARIVGLLPGSRECEVRALLPIMLEAASRVTQSGLPGGSVTFLLAQAASISSALIDELVAGAGVPVRVVRDQPQEVMAAADLLLAASGTATLQAAVIGTPTVIVYRTTWLTYWLARAVIKVRWIGLANLVADRSIMPELIQGDATAGRLAEEAIRLLSNEDARQAMKTALRQVREAIGAPGASRRAAEAIVAECPA